MRHRVKIRQSAPRIWFPAGTGRRAAQKKRGARTGPVKPFYMARRVAKYRTQTASAEGAKCPPPYCRPPRNRPPHIVGRWRESFWAEAGRQVGQGRRRGGRRGMLPEPHPVPPGRVTHRYVLLL